MRHACDLAILGSGFAGSLMAMSAASRGWETVVLERGRHPRFAIGESTSPLANLLLEELARRCDLPRLLTLTEYGRWKRACPELPVGLKRGFTFYGHTPGEPYRPDQGRRLLVGASPNDEVADTHWYRQAFDHRLVEEARELGVEVWEETSVDAFREEADGVTLTARREGRPLEVRAKVVLDATGPRGALVRLLDLPWRVLPGLDPPNRGTQALFSHFTGVDRFERLAGEPGPTPYPPDDAALHHLFPGGWIWVLRFDNGVTSAGAAVEDGLAAELRLAEGVPAWERLLVRFPSIGRQFAEAEAVLPFVHQPRLAFQCLRPAGRRWALLPSAAAFADPLFSTGFPLALLGIHRLLDVLEAGWETPAGREMLAEYLRATHREAERSAALVRGCFDRFALFPAFAALSMLYFAAASYSELARRLGRPERARGFLLAEDEAFDRAWAALLAAPPSGPSLEEAGCRLAPFNVAGLCDPSKRGLYPADAADAIRGAPLLGATPAEVRDLLHRLGCL